MSYDVEFLIDGNRVAFDEPLDIRGGTYVHGGTPDAWLNITYSYGQVFNQLFENDYGQGIRALYGKTASDLLPILQRAIDRLHGGMTVPETLCGCHKSTDCYWAVTVRNIEESLISLQRLASRVPPNAVFAGD